MNNISPSATEVLDEINSSFETMMDIGGEFGYKEVKRLNNHSKIEVESYPDNPTSENDFTVAGHLDVFYTPKDQPNTFVEREILRITKTVKVEDLNDYTYLMSDESNDEFIMITGPVEECAAIPGTFRVETSAGIIILDPEYTVRAAIVMTSGVLWNDLEHELAPGPIKTNKNIVFLDEIGHAMSNELAASNPTPEA